MKFFSQIKLLVWKNFTLRKRQTKRNIIEIAWPLVIFLILVAVRTKRPPERIGNLSFRPRALPSTGLLPFVQSFFCDYKGRTLNYSDVLHQGDELPNLQNSSFAKLVEDAIPLIENGTLRNRLIRLNRDYGNYLRDQQQWAKLLEMYRNSTNVTRDEILKNFIDDPKGFQQYVVNQIGLSNQITQDLMTAKLNMTTINSFLLLSKSFPSPAQASSPSQMQLFLWSMKNYNVILDILQGRRLNASEIRIFACDPTSPFAVEKLIVLSQGNITEVKSALCALNDKQLQNLTAELRKRIKIPTSFPNTTVLQEQREVLQRLIKDVQNLNKDVQALLPLENVLRDYQALVKTMSGSQPDIRQMLCRGRWTMNPNGTSNMGQGLSSSIGGPALEFLRGPKDEQKAKGNGTRRWPYSGYDNCTYKLKAYPRYLKVLRNETVLNRLGQDKCSVIEPKKRIDCGWPGMSPSQCSQLGCCFDSTIKGAHYCFYEPKKARCGCILGTAAQSFSGGGDKTRRPSYDRGFVQLSQLFLRGEILYTPDNPTTRKIISSIKGELSDIARIEQFADWWINNSDTIRSSLKDASAIYKTFNDQNGADFMKILNNRSFPGYSRIQNVLDNPTFQFLLTNVNGSRQNVTTIMDTLDGAFKSLRDAFRCFNHEYFRGFSDEDSLVRRAMNMSRAPVIASLVFENVNGSIVPRHVKYKIRQDIDFTPGTDKIRGWYWRPGPNDGFTKYGYLNFGFLFIQDLLDRALMNLILNETVYGPGVYVQHFPYPCYIKDRFVWYIGGPMPLLMTLAWVYSVAMIIKGIVYEKEKKLKEVMKVMGLGRTVHWIAWFINSSVLMLISIILLVITMKYGLILANSNGFIIFLFLVIFMVATIMMCFLISVFFSRANVAAACGGIIFFITYLPYSLVRWFEAFMNTSEKAVSCLSSTTAFGLACSYFARYEEQGTGIQWNNLFSSPIEGDGFSLGHTLTMMLVDAVLYGVLTWYLEAVMPGQYGIAKPWYFPFLKSYWFPKKSKDFSQTPYQANGTDGSPELGGFSDRQMAGGMDEVSFQQDEDQDKKDIAIETEPMHLPLGVSIKDLVKIYKEGGTVAVDGLSLNLYEGQIMSFLGHNGAGKTTTMSILTGLFAPTSGTAVISGLDIRKDIDLVRKSLGMCPQYNVLFDQLTVQEHLWFYSTLKGMHKSKIPQEIEKFLRDIGLVNKKDELAANLSGGMKRKLSVGMAFIAGSKVVILDEPTAGVDPYARRGIWDLLLKYKPGRTVLLSTHHMDEADVLGDRIAIISQGKLQCCGSSLFLKGHYGNGYYLTLTKRSPEERPGTAGTLKDVKLRLEDVTESSSSDEGVFLDSRDASERDSLGSGSSGSDILPSGTETDLHCNETTVTAFIKNHIATAQLVEHVGSELTYVLPTEAAKEGKFQDMFEGLDRNLEKLRVGTYGVSDTTLEEVFLKVAEEAVDENADKFAAEVPKRRSSFRRRRSPRGRVRDSYSDTMDLLENMEEVQDDEPVDTDAIDGSNDVDRKSTGFKLLLRQFWALLVKRFHHARRNKKAFASQIILPAAFVCLAMIVAQIRPFSEMPPLLLSTKMFQDSIPHEQYMLVSNNDPNDRVAKNLTDTFLQYPGVGVTCMDQSCPRGPIVFKGPKPRPTNSSPECSCSSGISECPAGAGGPPPQIWDSYSGDILQNMTERNISGYLLKTYGDFIKRRYGGVTFGDNVRNLPRNLAMSQDPVVRRLVSPRNTKAWFNNKGYHSMPTYLNVLSNTILRNKAKEKGFDPAEFGISATNHPMNYTKEQLGDQTIIKQAVDVLVAICVVFALSFVPASFVVFLVTERASKAKHLHMVSGVRPYIYWAANYVWDMCNYVIPAILCILIFLCFNDKSYTSAANFPPTLCLLLLYGWAITPLMYPASYVFSVPSTAYIVLICTNLFIGVNCTLATFILEMFREDEELTQINDSLKIIFLAFPNYCLGRGLIDLAKNQFMDLFSRFGQNLVRDPFSWDITGRNILAMIIQGFVFFTLNVLIEYRFFIKKKSTKNVKDVLAEEDDDVLRERQRIASGTGSSTDAMRLVNLTKVYNVRKRSNLAVNQLCVGVTKGECFGLLGVNGAGKTTTFEMLTGDIPVTSGVAYVNGYNILSEIHDARRTMGYCPQFDGLDNLLTAKEHLFLYARLRGVPEEDIKNVVQKLIHKMNLTQYQDVCAGKYSGGNKRKLSTAIALVGNPNIIFMDEPTTGMDPRARRFLWNIITSIIKEGRTVILTSHSMEECEALCNRVAIMVNGQFKCLGSPQHLKNKYGDGYTIMLRVAGPNPQTEQVSEFIKTVFPNAILKDKHLNMLEYQIPSQGLSVASVFGHLEANRKIFDIEDYSVSQTTLDQVFINFAKEQTDGMNDPQERSTGNRSNFQMHSMRYSHLIEGIDPDESINV